MRDNGSSVRWQSNAVTQLGYAVSLFIAFATASFGFTFSLAKELSPCLDRSERHRFHVALFLFLLSTLLGALCVLCRLADFRKTARIARRREKLFEEGLTKMDVDCRLACNRYVVKWLGKATWWLFYSQMAALIGGMLAVGIAIWRANIV